MAGLDPTAFHFGLEFETILTDDGFRPLSHEELSFERLRDLVKATDMPSYDYLHLKYPGSDRRNYYLEGYDFTDDAGAFDGLDVKGVEITTPVADSIDECLRELTKLYGVLADVLHREGLRCSCYGTFPGDDYAGRQGVRDEIAWPAAEVAMTTFGIHVNISLPDRLEADLDRRRVRFAFEYFAPALVALSGDTPVRPRPDSDDPQFVSERSYRRSFTRRPMYFRDDQHYRKEITLFDMTNSLPLIGGYLAVCLGLLLDDQDVPFLPPSFADANVRAVAQHGYTATILDRRFRSTPVAELVDQAVERAAKALASHGMSTNPLEPLGELATARRSPADDTIARWRADPSMASLLRARAQLESRFAHLAG
jgi:hypothetical protein